MPAVSSLARRSSISRVPSSPSPEFLLDGLELLAEIELALALRELALHLGLDAAAQFHQLELAREVEQNLVEPRQAVGLFEQLLPLHDAPGRAGCRPRNRPAGPVRRSARRWPRGRRRGWAKRQRSAERGSTTFCRSASTSGVRAGSISSSFSIRPRRKGSVAVNSRMRMRAVPSQNSSRLSRGTRMALCITQRVPISYRSFGCGASTRGSSCETIARARFSPMLCTSATELGRPMVIGNIAPG